MKHADRVFPGIGFFIFFLIFGGTAFCQEPSVERSSFPARGHNQTLLHIPAPGRYSIQVQSSQGTSIELIDRMGGPMFSAGTSGKQDGRLDVLLDEGAYKLRFASHSQGRGALNVQVFAFHEVDALQRPEDFPQLQTLHEEHGTLNDLQQRSYWLYLQERQALHLEAIGRNLKDCRLWRQEKWLVDVKPTISTYEAVSGQPMTYLEFHHDLNPGMYRITFYGGEALAWANDAPSTPFHLRVGLPEIGTNGQQILTISPFGRDSFLVSGWANFFELKRREKKETALRVGAWKQGRSRHGVGKQVRINKKSRDPWCRVAVNRSSKPHLLTIKGQPGDRVVLTHFEQRDSYRFSSGSARSYWISNLASAGASDALDLTALLVHRWSSNSKISIEKSQTLELDRQHELSRRVNLLGKLTLYLNVGHDGTYRIDEDEQSGAAAWYRIEPLLFWKPKDYRAPAFQAAGNPIELTKGYYLLTMKPKTKGIVDFRLRHTEDIEPQARPAEDTSQHLNPARQRILWPQVNISRVSDERILTVNRRHGVVSGLIVRPLPLDLSDPLPIMLLPDEQISIQTKLDSPSHLIVKQAQASPFEISGYAEPISDATIIPPGRYTFLLKNTGRQPTLFSLKAVSAQTGTPLTKTELIRHARNVDHFPVLSAAQPVYRDFEREEKQQFTLLVEEAGLYRLETGGRLATRITVRNHFTPSLFSAERNGIGRNALVQQYLNPGEYQVTVQTLGRSKGRVGLHLRKTPLQDEIGLGVGTRKKARLLPDEALRYRLEIAKTGNYRIETLGLNKRFYWRLEDAEGWPLLSPNQQGGIQGRFTPGNYYYYSLPDAVESRRITTLEAIKRDPAKLQGKGPHPLVFNQQIQHVWREEAGRPPDIFVLEIPDPVETSITLTEDMAAEIYFAGGEKITGFNGGDAQSVFLEKPGRYEFRVTSLEKNDRLPYTLRVRTDWLISGGRQPVSRLPMSLTVSVADDGLIDLFSFGGTDVKATLWRDEERIAAHDDMRNDWNFRISRQLEAGIYRLDVEQVGVDPLRPLSVGMKTRGNRGLAAQQFPFTLTTQLANDVISVPFVSGTSEELLHLFSTGPGTVKLALFNEKRLLAQEENELFLPLRAATDYTLLAWRSDDSEGDVTLNAQAMPIVEIPLNSQGATLTPSLSGEQPRALKLTQADSVSYTIKSASPYRYTSGLEQPFIAGDNVPIVLPHHVGWLLRQAASATDSAQITPLTLKEGEHSALQLDHAWLPFNIVQESENPVLFEIASTGATIGAMAVEPTCCPSQALNWFGMWREPSRTLLAVPGAGTYRATIWPTNDETIDGKIIISQRAFPLASRTMWREESFLREKIQPGTAHKITLNEQLQALNVVLSKGLIAYVWHNGRAEAFVAALNANTRQHISVQGGDLFLLNAGTEPAMYRLERLSASEETIASLDVEKGFEQVFRSSGTLTLRIHATTKHIYLSGEQIDSRFLRDDGYIYKNDTRSASYPGGSGLLEIKHGPGYVKVWQSQPEERKRAFLGDVPEIPVEALQNGMGTLHNNWQRRQFSLEEPTYLIVNAQAPGVTALLKQKDVLEVSIGSQNNGRILEYFLPAGTYVLLTRPLKGMAQQGALYIRKIVPLDIDRPEQIGERLVQPGETHVYRFHVNLPSNVGVAVRTESDRLETKLFSAQFETLAEGPLILQTLKPGDYILTVRPQTDASEPIRYRPALFGHHGSRQGIPPDVREEYQQFLRP